MILIRPFIRGNSWRFEKFNLVLFIFIVSNCGGALSPIGDPPLFVGYLKGVPFFWVFKELWYKWLIGIGLLLMIFYFMDRRRFERQREALQKAAEEHDVLRFEGMYNVFFLVIIVAATFVNDPLFVREAIMIAAAAASYYFTPKRIHNANVFNFHPIAEVAILFAAIFAAMVPALDWLSANANQLGMTTAKQFYWSTGILSAVLDNAPTYLNFLATGMGLSQLSVNNPADVMTFAREHAGMLQAISVAAVFFGAMTYIGNGPNFMCKAIAEHAKMPAPTFMEYIWKYSLPLLLPILIVIYFLIR
jgi:Na+/H+ antiporter NhaD/arsenite permease-like protein